MLGIIGAIASLLGLSLQVYESFIKKNKGDLGEYMGAIIALTETVQCWKEIHHSYQSLAFEIDAIRPQLYTTAGKVSIVKSPGDLAPNDLRSMFASGMMTDAVHFYRNKLEGAVTPLRNAANLDSNSQKQMLQKVSSVGNANLVTHVTNIVTAENGTIVLHDNFCNFLDTIQNNMQKSQWDINDSKFILDNADTIGVKYDQVVKYADIALISFLSLIEMLADEAKRKHF